MDLRAVAARHPDKIAAVLADGSNPVTFAELNTRSAALADDLATRGLARGDHIAVLMANRPEYLEACWAAQRSGLYYTPVNWHLTAAESAYVVNDCGARVLVADDTVAPLAGRVLAESARVEAAIMAGAPARGFLLLRWERDFHVPQRRGEDGGRAHRGRLAHDRGPRQA